MTGMLQVSPKVGLVAGSGTHGWDQRWPGAVTSQEIDSPIIGL